MLAAASRVVYGTEPAEISLLRFLSYARSADGLLSLVETPGGAQQDRVVEGTAALAESLARRLGPRLRLDWPVAAVRQDASGVTLSGPRGSLWAERVILALPPHLVGRLAFDPPLPARTDQWLQRFPMGATTKVVVTYDRPFWRDAGLSGEVVCDRPPFSVIVDNTTADGRAALLGFVVGKAARDLSGLPPAERQQQTLAALVRFFGPEAARPTAWAEKAWANEVYSGGCPTGNPIPGALVDLGDQARAPFGRVYWAGTETATRWTGYMEGAVESGERAFAEVKEATS
jgi:monoamine oxidase